MLVYAGDFDFPTRTSPATSSLALAPARSFVWLPVNPGKSSDSRAAGFIQRYGALMQVELNGLDPAR